MFLRRNQSGADGVLPDAEMLCVARRGGRPSRSGLGAMLFTVSQRSALAVVADRPDAEHRPKQNQ